MEVAIKFDSREYNISSAFVVEQILFLSLLFLTSVDNEVEGNKERENYHTGYNCLDYGAYLRHDGDFK